MPRFSSPTRLLQVRLGDVEAEDRACIDGLSIEAHNLVKEGWLMLDPDRTLIFPSSLHLKCFQ